MADVIRQEELETVVRLATAQQVLMASLSRRIHAGATVEPGAWDLAPMAPGELPAHTSNAVEAAVCGSGRISPAGTRRHRVLQPDL